MKWLNVTWLVPVALLALAAKPASDPKAKVVVAPAPEEHSILCDAKNPKTVRVPYGRWTILNFPFKPKDVIPGEASFDFKEIKNDLVIKAMSRSARTNLAVYLEDRRCTFELVTVSGRGDAVLTVRDPKDEQMGVPTYE